MKTQNQLINKILICTGLLLAGTGTLKAGNDIWNGLGADNNWGTTANWTTGSANRPPASGDTVIFDGGTRLLATNNLAATYNLAGITFNPTASAFTLAGNLFTNNAAINDYSLNTQTINLNMTYPGAHTLNVVSGGTLTLNGIINGAGGITKAGGGTLTLSGSSPQAYTGATTVNGGTLTLDFVTGAPGPNIINKASALALGGGTLNLLGTGSIATSSNLFAGVTINAGSSTISVGSSAGVALGAITENAGGTVEFVGPATTNSAGTVAATGTITTTTAGTGTFGSLGTTGTGSSGAYATVGLYDFASTDNTSGTAGSSPYTIIGGSQVAGFYQTTGITTTTAIYDVNPSGVNTVGSAIATPAIRFNNNSAQTVTFTATTVQLIQGFLVTPTCGANNQTIAGSSAGVEFGRAQSTLNTYGVIWQNDTAGYLNFASSIQGGKTGYKDFNGLVQSGPGTVVYSVSNPYELGTYLNGGFSVITADNQFGAVVTNSTVTLNGGSVVGNATFTMDNAGANKRPFVLGNNGGGFAATAGNTMTIDGVVSGSGVLNIGIPASSANSSTVGLLPGSGTGTANTTPVYATGVVALGGANTYTGNTLVYSGTLQVTNSSSISTTPQIITAPNAVFDVSTVPGFTLGGSQSLAGSGTNNGSINTSSGTTIYAGTDGTYGTNTFNNNLTNAAGALVYLDLGTIYNGSNDLINVGGTLALNSTTFHLKAPSASANLDTSADYVLATAASISGTPNSTPVWDILPLNAANFVVTVSGNSVVLHYSVAAPPSGSGLAKPSTVNRNQSTLITVTATPGSNPIGSVVLNTSLIGGTTVTLVQSNSSSIYTNTVAVSAGTAPGAISLPATISDTTTPTPLTAVVNIALTVINSQTWDGLSTADSNWSDGTNWLSGVAPVAGDFLTFAGSTLTTPSMDANNNVTGLAFASGAASFIIGTPGSSLTLSANGITNNSANAQTVNVPITLSAAQTFNASAGNLTLGQSVTNGGNLISVDGANNTTLAGSISGSGGLTKNGSGTNYLSASNSFSGAITINAGSLVLTGTNSNSGATTINSGSSTLLTVNGGSLSGTTLTMNSANASLGFLQTAGSSAFSGNVSFSADNGNNANNMQIAGGVFNANSLTSGRCNLSLSTQPTSGQSTTEGIHVTSGATVNITNTLGIGGASSSANSSTSFRMDGGTVNVGGTTRISIANGTRWSVLDVNGGTFTSADLTGAGIQIGGGYTAVEAIMLLRAGVVSANTITFGDGTQTSGSDVFSQTGGTLYVGSGGVVLGTGSPAYSTSISLNSGTVGALANWSTTMPMTLSGTVTFQAADASDTAHNISLAGILSGSGAALTKTGNGTLTFSGVNTYSGATAINAGTLALNNDGSTTFGAIASSLITVANGATFDVSGVTSGFTLGSGKTIAGTGTINGTFAAVDGSTVSPAGTGAEGNLNFATGLILTNTTLKLELTSDPTDVISTNDSISVTGDLIVGGSNNVVIVPVGSLGLGTYKLIAYTGSFYGDISNLTCVAGTLTNAPGEIDLIVTSIRPVANLVWRGDGSLNTWDTGVSSNWLNGVSLDRFYTGDTNTFDDTATNFIVNLSGTLTPASGSVVLVNATNNYIFVGGDISGSTGLTKNNTGKLTIQANQDYTGITTINGGTLSVSNLAVGGTSSSIGAAGTTSANLVLNGGTLEYLGGNKTIDRGATFASAGTLSVASPSTTLTINGSLTGAGSLTKTGNGQITLGGANNYQGGTIIAAGSIRANPASGLGTNTLTLNGTTSTATFTFSGDSQVLSDVLNVSGTNNFTVNGGNDTVSGVTGSGTVYLNGSGSQTLTLQTPDTTGFTGTFFGNTLPFLRLFPNSGTTLIASNATFNLGPNSTQLINRDGGNYYLGALAGGSSTYVKGSANSGSAVTTYTIGGNNQSSDFSGIIATGTGGSGAKVNIVKVGSGKLTLSGANTYNGSTTVSYGTLALGDGATDGSINNSTPLTLNSNTVVDVTGRSDGTLQLGGSATQLLVGYGTINGQLNVGSSGTITPGDTVSAIGKIIATNSITLGGTVSLKINRTNSPNADQLVSSNTIACGGTLTVANVGSALQLGDSFTLFNAASGLSGSFTTTNLPALAGGRAWSLNPTTGVLSVVAGGPSGPGSITNSISGSTLTRTWPAGQCWRLVCQTNTLSSGLNSNPSAWGTVPGVTDGSATITIDPTQPTVFYQLVYP